MAWVGRERPAGLHRDKLGELDGIQPLGAVDGQVVANVGQHPLGLGARIDRSKGQPVEASADRDGRLVVPATSFDQGVASLLGESRKSSGDLGDPLR